MLAHQHDGSSPHHFDDDHTIAGVFSDRAEAERAIQELLSLGFTADAIGIAMRDRDEHGQLIDYTGHIQDHDDHERTYHPHTGTGHAAEGAVVGALGGGAVGGVLGFIVGATALAIPGIGPAVFLGSIAAAWGIAGGTAFVGVGVGAAAGSLVGTLVGLGISEEEAHVIQTGFFTGGTVVTVRSGTSREKEAMEVLNRHGALSEPLNPGVRIPVIHPGAAGTKHLESHA